MAAVAALACLVLGVVAFMYASSQSALSANADEQTGVGNVQSFFVWHDSALQDNVTLPVNATLPCGDWRMVRGRGDGSLGFYRFLENATLASVQGTVVSEVKDMLILNADSTQVRILLPSDWTLGNEVVSGAVLFNGTFASAGQSVTLKVLESEVFNNSNFSLNVMMGYEAVNATGAQAYAVLPFNIQPSS
jgi:hypothetical protein